ncbi:MAG: hypothetical protein JRF33_17205, partial [Deltaproteobacteria bacterium]|nr:hypothetical protein [Deltaproteobacteria bacterium]
NSCLQDGQIPTDNESCNNVGEFCPQPNQVCADRFDGTLACLEFCGLCPTDLECTFLAVGDGSGLDLCMQDGNIPDTASQCDPDDYRCPDGMLCMEGEEGPVCVAVCSHGS